MLGSAVPRRADGRRSWAGLLELHGRTVVAEPCGRAGLADEDVEDLAAFLSTSEGLPRWRGELVLKPFQALGLSELDLGGNEVGDAGAVALICALLEHKVHLRVLRLHRNRIGEVGAAAIANLLGEGPGELAELHLSHNLIGPEAAEDLLHAAARRPEYPPGRAPPLWLRLEQQQNRGDWPSFAGAQAERCEQAARMLEAATESIAAIRRRRGWLPDGPHGPLVCMVADEEDGCRPRSCGRAHAYGPVIHLPYFWQQGAAEGAARSSCRRGAGRGQRQRLSLAERWFMEDAATSAGSGDPGRHEERHGSTASVAEPFRALAEHGIYFDLEAAAPELEDRCDSAERGGARGQRQSRHMGWQGQRPGSLRGGDGAEPSTRADLLGAALHRRISALEAAVGMRLHESAVEALCYVRDDTGDEGVSEALGYAEQAVDVAGGVCKNLSSRVVEACKQVLRRQTTPTEGPAAPAAGGRWQRRRRQRDSAGAPGDAPGCWPSSGLEETPAGLPRESWGAMGHPGDFGDAFAGAYSCAGDFAYSSYEERAWPPVPSMNPFATAFDPGGAPQLLDPAAPAFVMPPACLRTASAQPGAAAASVDAR